MGLNRISIEPLWFPNSLLFTVDHMSPAWFESSRVVLTLSAFTDGAESYPGLISALPYSSPVTARLGNTSPTGTPLSQLCFQLISAQWVSVSTVCGGKKMISLVHRSCPGNRQAEIFICISQSWTFFSYFELRKYTADFGHGLPIGEIWLGILWTEKIATNVKMLNMI